MPLALSGDACSQTSLTARLHNSGLRCMVTRIHETSDHNYRVMYLFPAFLHSQYWIWETGWRGEGLKILLKGNTILWKSQKLLLSFLVLKIWDLFSTRLWSSFCSFSDCCKAQNDMRFGAVGFSFRKYFIALVCYSLWISYIWEQNLGGTESCDTRQLHLMMPWLSDFYCQSCFVPPPS